MSVTVFKRDNFGFLIRHTKKDVSLPYITKQKHNDKGCTKGHHTPYKPIIHTQFHECKRRIGM